MSPVIIFSEDVPPIEWHEAEKLLPLYGPKAAYLATIPRAWTLPFAIVPCNIVESGFFDQTSFLDRLKKMVQPAGGLYVRSSIIGETIWDRGSYESILVNVSVEDFPHALQMAVSNVQRSASGRQTGIVLQAYRKARDKGEFGNLLRVSKTRDQWELSSSLSPSPDRKRFNVQRDIPANPDKPIEFRAGLSTERLFGPVAAWLNNKLLRGLRSRVTCEWIEADQKYYLVQLDREDPDTVGLDPSNIEVPVFHRSVSAHGTFLKSAEGEALTQWDKLRVLEELWEPNASYRPTLFYVPLTKLPSAGDLSGLKQLEADFQSMIGPDNIIVRTSVRCGEEKIPNLPRTEGLTPSDAAAWCLETRDRIGCRAEDLSFVIHRFIASRSSAWVRCDPDDPVVEINSIWGLPDALQYCPYDIWEVHLDSRVTTDYPRYKSDILLPAKTGKWHTVKIKNECARHLSIGAEDALNLASRTYQIAIRLGKPCHVMWFIGCVDETGDTFSLPWYWTEAHETERNPDRVNYQTIKIKDIDDLNSCISSLRGTKTALELVPTDQDVMRDTQFIESVGRKARELSIPIILAGSPLAHAYFILRRLECTVITKSEKIRDRIRKADPFGKIVRDKIPSKIHGRKETETYLKVPPNLAKRFLYAKILEETLEIKNAKTTSEKQEELADLFEIVCALANMEGIKLADVFAAADKKREKVGGFTEGFVLFKTEILARNRENNPLFENSHDKLSTNINLPLNVDNYFSGAEKGNLLGDYKSQDVYELPFTFVGFMNDNETRHIVFKKFGVNLGITIRKDKIEFSIQPSSEQLDLPLSMPTTNKPHG